MKALLEYFLAYFEFLYLDPRYRITDSSTRGLAAIDASLRLTGPTLSWNLTNDRGQMQLTVAPTELATPENWFWVSLIRQHLNGDDEIEYLSTAEEIEWARENSGRIEQLFSDSSAIAKNCEALRTLRQFNAETYWTRWRKQQGLAP
ncbi:hypothetical protein [Mycobacterium xenopi]|uniref:Uncharacterized protein n=1 Tax=Mycobacterium xenopi TaxID=1789 RepID=A0AAD1H4X0_MYCXE|nr:hypothetical protein [Mycobacterium xenopi]EUA42889.1 hypothetical protein I552_7630 [Mycobacterium xenopi 3993]MDA3642266.1 hypothetical protein [Mycobacterium xenopi]MDA3660348.1 hypothetical protein [Mycobacterium xenopi]MDA3664923.1 hypothetical protein [Mycobacterium xenopi]ORX22167.1 hypothetical protein AWC32_19720 [Mycobacterium xenopi]